MAQTARYTVEHRGGCILITGAVPMGVMRALAADAPLDSILDADAARVLGVSHVIGNPRNVRKLRMTHTTTH